MKTKNFSNIKILVGCEESGILTEEFRKLGFNAYSCDLLDTSGNLPEYHIKDDVMNHINNKKYNVGIFFPPCTHLCLSGIRWFNQDKYYKKLPGYKNIELQINAINFFKKLYNSNIKHIAIENPVGILSSKFKKPDQIIKPYEYGDNSTKKTCLWLKNLPKLQPTNIIKSEKHISKNGKIWDKWFYKTSLISDLKIRSKIRSKTFPGIAYAMALQWGNYLKNIYGDI